MLSADIQNLISQFMGAQNGHQCVHYPVKSAQKHTENIYIRYLKIGLYDRLWHISAAVHELILNVVFCFNPKIAFLGPKIGPIFGLSSWIPTQKHTDSVENRAPIGVIRSIRRNLFLYRVFNSFGVFLSCYYWIMEFWAHFEPTK